MQKKSLVILVVIIVLLGWLVASSVQSFQQITTGNNNTSTPGGSGNSGTGSPGSGGTGSNGNGGNGNGGSGFSGFSGFGGFSGWPFSLNFSGNFHFPSFNFPKLNLSFLNFSFPKFNLNLSSLNPFGGGGGGGKGTGTGSPGAGNGKGSGTGSSNGGNTIQKIIPFVLNPYIIIAIIAVVSVVLAVTVLRQQNRKSNSSEKKKEEEVLEVELQPDIAPDNNKTMNPGSQLPLENHEKISSIQGWGERKQLILPDIKEDLPLIWALDIPISVKVPEKSELVIPMNLSRNSDGEYSLTFSDRCTMVKAANGRLTDIKWFRAVDYSDDIRKFFHMNFMDENSSVKDSTTPRELIEKIIKVSDPSVSTQLEIVLESFERSFYGHKPVGRSDYERYLRGLASSVPNAKIIICSED